MPGQISQSISLSIHGRGAGENPTNRFEKLDVNFEPGDLEDLPAAPQTQYFHDTTRKIIVSNDSPDVGFSMSVNPYRGCEHGCIYCYARPTHEYLGFSPGLDFESRIMVKVDAAKLLREELAGDKWKPQTLAMSGVTDCYQPIERKMRVTRSCLEVLAECRNPVGIITKSHLVTRDIDLLKALAAERAAVVFISITSLEKDIAQLMEPRASSPRRRLDAIAELAAAKIPVGVMCAPVVPGLTDHEMPRILSAAAEAGARFCGYTIVRLPFAVKDLFAAWLERHFPDRKDKVLNRIREMHHGKLNESDWGVRMSGSGVWAEQIRSMYELAKRQAGLNLEHPSLSTDSFRRPQGAQMRLF